jgi:hypothetical protein
MAFRIDTGRFGDTPMDGPPFVVVGFTPGRMIDGNWSVGILAGEGATHAQQEALGAICAGRRVSGEPMCVDNSGHPANNRLGLAKARRSHLHALGLDWDDVSGGNNAHLAPFDWRHA